MTEQADHKNWFIDLETKEQMNAAAIGDIEEIMGELHTTAPSKVIEVAQTLRDLNQAWNAKEPLLQTEAPREISHLDCTIDMSKVESLMQPRGIERGPACGEYQCFKCKRLYCCFTISPTTLYFCKTECNGNAGVGNCPNVDKENDQ